MVGIRRRTAFTLIEILIVVVIMAVLAALIVPQFSTVQNDAKVSAAQKNLFGMRSLVLVYMLEHGNTLPTASVAQQFTQASDVTGTIFSASQTTQCPFGPYCQTIPVNPFTGSSAIAIYAGTTTPQASGSSSAGWIYGTATGSFWIDNATYMGL